MITVGQLMLLSAQGDIEELRLLNLGAWVTEVLEVFGVQIDQPGIALDEALTRIELSNQTEEQRFAVSLLRQLLANVSHGRNPSGTVRALFTTLQAAIERRRAVSGADADVLRISRLLGVSEPIDFS